MKKCTKCGKIKKYSEFHRYKKRYVSWCKRCRALDRASDIYKERILLEEIGKRRCTLCNAIKLIEEFEKNGKGKSYRCTLCKRKLDIERYYRNHDKSLASARKYRNNNLEKTRARYREYYKKNRKRLIDYTKNKIKYDIQRKIRHNLSVRIKKVLRGERKYQKTMDFLECSAVDFKAYIESQFDDKMCWENWGDYWHLDHIRPCNSFDLRNEDEQKACFHYTNYQPLSKRDNIVKSDKYIFEIV